LDHPRAADAAAAALDNAVQDGDDEDPSVKNVDARAPGSRSPTPPPPVSQARLVDVIAARAARGEAMPGIADEDSLLEGRQESDVENNVQAVDSGKERSGRVVAKRSLAGDADTEPDRKSGKSAKKSRRPTRSPSPQAAAVDSDDPDHRTTSRHKPVSNSAIYTAYEGPILTDVRRRFQTLIFARDGSPIKTLTIHRHLNYKLVLNAARDVMEPKMYRDFKNAMDIAYKDTSKE
jgi:hypothetical protein